ncbi:protein translocase subunit SecD [soil metagenome]
MSLKYRIGIIVALVLASLWSLFPRTTVERVKRDGVFVYDTVKRVPLKRGLDLQGGMHLSLEIDESEGRIENHAEAIERALTVVRSRVDELGVSEPVVQKVGDDRMIVELPGVDDPQRAQDIVQKSAFLQFQITDKTQALDRVLPRLDAVVRDRAGQAAPVSASADTATAPGTPAPLQSLFARDTAVADSAVADTTAADTSVFAATTGGPVSSLIQQGTIPGEYFVPRDMVDRMVQYLAIPEVQSALPPGKVVRWGSDTTVLSSRQYRPLYVLDVRAILTGEHLTDAQPNQTPIEGTLVSFELNNEGGRIFRRETGRHVGDYMAIVLDNRVMGRPPVIQSAIGTRGQITMGGRNLQAAQDLALVLRAGALPVPLKVAEVRTIGPSLGQDSINQGMLAGVISISLVIVAMLFYYRKSGGLAVAGLATFMLFTMAMLASFGAVLTLPGIAGLVLSVGMAVDANVLIFERIREELDRGKTVRMAVDEGFRHAMSAIVDSNVTTALTAAVLYQYGTGPVQGFAVTLLAGLAASMVSAIFVVRTFYMIWLSRRQLEALSI